MQHLLPAEREELPRERRGALRRGLDLHEIVRRTAVRRHALAREVRVAGDHLQQVVEVVRDAGRELPHGFHLLRLSKLRCEPSLLGDVAPQADDRAIRQPQVRPRGVARAAVARMHHPLAPLAGNRCLDERTNARAERRIRKEMLEDWLRRTLGAWPSGHALPLGVREQRLAIGTVERDHRRDVLEDSLEELGLLLPLLLGDATLRDVMRVHDDAAHRLVVDQVVADGVEDARRPVLVDHAILHGR
jgi:hypothetical protein